MKLLAMMALVISAPAMAQVYKCPDASGRTVIQQMPCSGGKELTVKPASGHTTAPLPRASAAAPVAAAAPASTPPPPQMPQQPVKDALTRDAETCFAWYAKTLANPRDAYYSRPSRDKRVVSITVHATNRMGGIVTQEARCEILNGRLDEGWTKIHAERVKW